MIDIPYEISARSKKFKVFHEIGYYSIPAPGDALVAGVKPKRTSILLKKEWDSLNFWYNGTYPWWSLLNNHRFY